MGGFQHNIYIINQPLLQTFLRPPALVRRMDCIQQNMVISICCAKF